MIDPSNSASLSPNDFQDLDDESTFRVLADNIPILCWIAHADGSIFWYNKRWHDYCGSTHETMKGWGWMSVHDPQVLPKVLERWRAAITAGQRFEMTFPLLGADGVFRPFLTRAQPVRDAGGDVIRWIGVNTEVADHVATEQALAAERDRTRDSEARFRAIADSMPQMVWSTLPDGFHDYYNARWYEFTGVEAGSTDGEGWNGMFHPEDQDRAWARWRHSLNTGEPYEIEYRLRHHSGAYRWTLGRAMPIRDDSGTITRWFGTCTDIDDSKRQTEQTELLSHELSHRIKNIFAVIAGLIGLSVRHHPEAATFAKDLRERVVALGQAHDFARPHSEASKPRAGRTTAHRMLRELFLPYPANDQGRIAFRGDDIGVDDRAATPLALIFHELATNASKYGALSSLDGRVELTSEVREPHYRIVWRERGGPPIAEAPTLTGFGSRLTTVSVEGQLGGRLSRVWEPEGLTVEITVPIASLTRPSRADARTR